MYIYSFYVIVIEYIGFIILIYLYYFNFFNIFIQYGLGQCDKITDKKIFKDGRIVLI